MAQSEVTTGNQLNDYTGNAALGGSEAAGYAKLDLSPLETYALKKYDTNVKDFDQQQKDKLALQEKFTDPNLYLFLDENYANQINPKLDQLKELSKKNLQMDPNSKEWYEFHNLYNSILQDNAGLKTVQEMKDKYKKLAENTADIHEKEQLDKYVGQLNGWKLGQEIPSYSKYFGPNLAHIPAAKVTTANFFEIGKTKDGFPTKRTVKKTVLDIHNVMPDAVMNGYKDPTSLKTGGDFSHTFMEMGPQGIAEANDKAMQAYQNQVALDSNRLQEKYQGEFDKYEKANPGSSFTDFMTSTGKSQELSDVYTNKDILPFKNGISMVDAAQDPYELAGYKYFTDPKTGKKFRMNLDDAQMNGFMAGTQNVPGAKSEVVKEELADELIKDATTRRGQNMEATKAKRALAEGRRQFNKLHPDVLPDNEFGNLLYGVNSNKVSYNVGGGAVALKNGILVDKDGNHVKSFSGEMVVPISAINNSLITEYNKYAGEKTVTKSDSKSTDPETGVVTNSSSTQTQMAGQIDVSSGSLNAKFENGVIKGFYAKDGSLIDSDMFSHITREVGYNKVGKYKDPDTDYGKNDDGGGDGKKAKEETKIDYNSLDPNGFKQEGANYRYKDGTLFDATGKVIK